LLFSGEMLVEDLESRTPDVGSGNKAEPVEKGGDETSEASSRVAVWMRASTLTVGFRRQELFL